MRRCVISIPAIALAALSLGGARGFATDWPMWRCDAQRTAVSPEALPDGLRPLWTLDLARPTPAWPPTQEKLQFDLTYNPVAMGKMLFVPSMVSDRVTAYDTETGAEKWRFYAEGPVRFAPVAANGKVWFISDDGYLYCLDAATGALRWKLRGGPTERKILGNDRLISTWPARGGLVLSDGKIYFAASIWPFMGTFIHAVDADTGKVVWTNSGSGSIFILQQHSSPAFAGVAPQGYFAVAQDKLLVAGGRTVPAAYDLKTGRFLYFHLDDRTFDKDSGGYAVGAVGNCFVNLRMPGQKKPAGAVYHLSDGAPMFATEATILTPDTLIGAQNGQLAALAPGAGEQGAAPKGPKAKGGKKGGQAHEMWSVPLPEGIEHAFLKAGSRVYCGGSNAVVAVEAPGGSIAWKAAIQGEPCDMLAADGKLFVVTREGRIACFGVGAGEMKKHNENNVFRIKHEADSWTEAARSILDKTGVKEGYCLAVGAGSGRLVEEVARQSKLRVVVIEPDAEKVAALRRTWDDAALRGGRLAILKGDFSSLPLPPYFASLIVSEDAEAAGLKQGAPFLQTLYRSLRPYGGVACLRLDATEQAEFEGLVKSASLEGGKVARIGAFATLTREGALPGAADWTHQYADAANTVTSKDKVVRAPLGLLWFGGPSHAGILPRHGHGPSPQVVGGRLFIEGPDLLRAVDVYTGRLLWEAPFKGLGDYYNITDHQPGANETGSNYASAPDGIYVAYGPAIVRLDPVTGAKLGEFRLPAGQGGAEPNWGCLSVSGDLLIAGASPIHVGFGRAAGADDEGGGKGTVGGGGNLATAKKGKAGAEEKAPEKFSLKGAFNAPRGQGSQRLVALDRHSGEVLWSRDAGYSFRHNAVAAGGGKVFCIDGMTAQQLDSLKPRGFQPQGEPRLLALDAHTGKEVWSVSDNVFGTWLAYSEEHDAVLEAGSKGPDRASDEPGKGMAVYRGANGQRLWGKDIAYMGPCVIRHDAIITQTGGPTLAAPPAKAFNLLTGQEVTQKHPLTGETIPWNWLRFKGCNTAIASEHLLTFRSAAACYADLEGGQGTTSLGGFKSGCTSNLIAADGVLNAPDYTRTCTCSYQNQASLALVPVAEDPGLDGVMETWSFDYYPAPARPAPARRFGLNFGAPGNHFAADGTLWLEAPSVGGPSPDVPVTFDPPQPGFLRVHASQLAGDPLNWVAASAVKGLTRVSIRPFLQPAASPKGEGIAGGAEEKGAGKKGGKGGKADGEAPNVKAFERNAMTLDEPIAPAPEGRFDKPRSYTVRLVFAELEDRKPGERVFDVSIQDKPALTRFDIAKEAANAGRVVVKEFRNVPIQETLDIAFHRVSDAEPLLCGLEAIAD